MSDDGVSPVRPLGPPRHLLWPDFFCRTSSIDRTALAYPRLAEVLHRKADSVRRAWFHPPR
jgi:hypothetical protein